MCDCEILDLMDARKIADCLSKNIIPIKSLEYREIDLDDFYEDDELAKRKHSSDKFRLKQASVLEENLDAKFEISRELYEAGAEELKKAFRNNETRGMMAVFKKDNGSFHDWKFYGCDWLEKNRYGNSINWQLEMDGDYELYVRDFNWNPKKVYSFAKNRNELVVTTNIYPLISMSKSKPMDKMCEMSVGLEREPPRMKELIWKTMIYSIKHSNRASRVDDYLERLNVKRNDVKLPEKILEDVIREGTPSMRILCRQEKLKVLA